MFNIDLHHLLILSIWLSSISANQAVLPVVTVFQLSVSPEARGETRLSMLEGDIRDSDFLCRACRGVSVVFHIASLIDVIGALDYSELYTVNVKGTAAYQPLKAFFGPDSRR